MKIALTGAGGMLATVLVPLLRSRGHTVTALHRSDLDITDAPAVHAVITDIAPDAVIQCAAFTRVDDAESQEATATAVNGDGSAAVAAAAAIAGARYLYPSTDYVFDGSAVQPIPVDAPVAPLGAYGRSKLAGERAALTVPGGMVVRTSWLYGPGGRNFVRTILGRARAGAPLRVVDDQRGAPTFTGSLADTIALLLEKDAPDGVYHATNTGDTTWFGLASAALAIAGIDADISPTVSASFPTPAARPAYSVLDCSATWRITGPAPHWRDALASAIADGL